MVSFDVNQDPFYTKIFCSRWTMIIRPQLTVPQLTNNYIHLTNTNAIVVQILDKVSVCVAQASPLSFIPAI